MKISNYSIVPQLIKKYDNTKYLRIIKELARTGEEKYAPLTTADYKLSGLYELDFSARNGWKKSAIEFFPEGVIATAATIQDVSGNFKKLGESKGADAYAIDPSLASSQELLLILPSVASCYVGKSIPTYLMNSEFFKVLFNTDLSVFPIEALPKEFKGYICFENGLMEAPPSRLSRSNEKITLIGAYVSFEGVDKPIQICPVTIEENLINPMFWLNDWSIKELLEMYRQDQFQSHQSKSLFKAIFLSILYISSGDPDLRILKPSFGLSPSQKKGLINKGVNLEEDYSDDLSNDVFLVSWSWKKDPLYTKEEWEVRPHFRAQRFGTGRQQVKVIWIAPHLAHRKKGISSNSDDGDTKPNPIHFEF